MTTQTEQPFAEVLCHRCGYDLRAHPPEGKCPECEASVAESRRLAAIPRRPAWKDADPRWRRRMLAGTWILVLAPLIHALMSSDWASALPVPTIFKFQGAILTLGDTLASYFFVYQPLLFCIGVVLLFSKERGRPRHRFDWTRRWGVASSYIVLLLFAIQFLQLVALVLAGIAALFLSMPPRYQPQTTRFFVAVSYYYLRYGSTKNSAGVALFAFTSVVILLACVPLFDALCSTGSKRAAAALLAPLALFALIYLAQAGWFYLAGWAFGLVYTGYVGMYFRPDELIAYLGGSSNPWYLPMPTFGAFAVEATKWCSIFGIAIWLSIAQLAAWRQKKGNAAQSSPSRS